MRRGLILLFKAPYVTSVLVVRSCYASNVILESSPEGRRFGKRRFPGEARSDESKNISFFNGYLYTTSVITPTVITVCAFHQLDAEHDRIDRTTSTEVTYGALNNKIKRWRIETVNLAENSVELHSSTLCVHTVLAVSLHGKAVPLTCHDLKGVDGGVSRTPNA